MKINAFLKFQAPGGPGALESLPLCLELEADWENNESEKPGHLVAGDAGSNNVEGPRPFLGPSPHPVVQ